MVILPTSLYYSFKIGDMNFRVSSMEMIFEGSKTYDTLVLKATSKLGKATFTLDIKDIHILSDKVIVETLQNEIFELIYN